MIEVARGCPSTGWSLCLPNGHTLLLASLYPEEAQTALLSDHFFAASFGAPVGEAVPVDGGWHLTGTWPYSSGIAWSTHFMGQTMVPGETKPMLFVAPRSSWEMLDDWGDSLGLKGSASHSVRFDGGFVDELFCLHELVMVDIDVDEPTPGYLLHGNPMYAGRSLGLFMCELTAVVVGAGRAVLDEYERIITSRHTTWGPKMLRYQHADYQRHLGIGMAQIHMAEAAVLHMAEEWTRLCRRGWRTACPTARWTTTASPSSPRRPRGRCTPRCRTCSSRLAPARRATASGCCASPGPRHVLVARHAVAVRAALADARDAPPRLPLRPAACHGGVIELGHPIVARAAGGRPLDTRAHRRGQQRRRPRVPRRRLPDVPRRARQEPRAVSALTDRPFGVNLFAPRASR